MALHVHTYVINLATFYIKYYLSPSQSSVINLQAVYFQTVFFFPQTAFLVNGLVLSGKLVKKCQLGTCRMQYCKLKQAQQERHLIVFQSKYSQSRFTTKGKTDAMVLKLIHFNQKKKYLQRQSTLSSTAQNEMINLFLLDIKQACRQALYSKNEELITGVEHHELANHSLCSFTKETIAANVTKKTGFVKTRTEMLVRLSSNVQQQGFTDVYFFAGQK